MEKIDALRLILESQQGRSVSYDEALEIGESLLSYFKLLAEEPVSSED